MRAANARIFCLFLIFISLATQAGANPPDGENRLGLYTLPSYLGEEFISIPSFGAFKTYLCLTGAEPASPLGAYDCRIQSSNSYILEVGTTLPVPGGVNVGNTSIGEFIVGFNTPFVSHNEVMVLAEIEWLWIGNAAQHHLYLTPVANYPIVPGQMSARFCADSGSCFEEGDYVDVPMVPSSGSSGSPVFGINTGRLFNRTSRFTIHAYVEREEDHSPLVGANVTLLKWGLPVDSGQTDGDGLVSFVSGEPADGEPYALLATFGTRTGGTYIGFADGIDTYWEWVSIPLATEVRGTLRDSFSQMAIADRSVVFTDGDETWTGTTDENGRFRFPYAPTGTKTFEISIRGAVGTGPETDLYKPQSSAPVTIEPGDLDIDLGTLDMKTNLVVLLHGIAGGADDWTAVAWPEHLRANGWAAYDDIDLPGSFYGDLHGLARIQKQARDVWNRIEKLGVKSVHVVAHSQGGLVARYMNEMWGGQHGLVDKMFCLATPHHGSPLAFDATSIIVWLGPAIVAAHPGIDSISPDSWRDYIRPAFPALYQLQPNSYFMKSLNQGRTGWLVNDWLGNCTVDDPNTEKRLKAKTSYVTLRGDSYGGTFEWGAAGLEMWRFGCQLSDGVVPTESARLHADADNVYNYWANVHHKAGTSRIFADTTVRDWVIQRLAQDPSSWPAESKGLDPNSATGLEDWGMVGHRNGLLPAAATLVDSMRVDACDTVRFGWKWYDGRADLVLTSPSGAVVDSSVAAGDGSVTRIFDPDYRGGVFLIENPEVGMWRWDITGEGSSIDQDVMVTVAAAGAVSMSAQIEPVNDDAYADRIVTVDLADATAAPITGAVVVADWTGPAGGSGQLALVDDGTGADATAGDGTYSGQLALEPQFGVTDLEVLATGGGGAPFTRNTSFSINEEAVMDVAVVDQALIATSNGFLALSPVDLSAFVSNSGAEDADVEVRFMLAGSGAVLDSIPTVIPAGGSVEYTSTHLPLEPGTYGYRVEVIPTGDFSDADLDNNTGQFTAEIGGPVSAVPGQDGPSDPETDLPRELGDRTAGIVAAYPNPFNPTISLEFAHEMAGSVEVRIFDGRGRLVRSLYAGMQPRGSFALQWHGDDDAGRTVGAGIYFVHFRSGAADDVRKVTLLK